MMLNSNKDKFIALGQFILVLAVSFTVLYVLGLVPKELQNANVDNDVFSRESNFNSYDNNTGSDSKISDTFTLPQSINIDSIGVNATVYIPKSQEVSILDSYLSKGAVYYPGSGSLEQGNVFIFGHSTGYRVVQNQAYKTFNGLDKLSEGDEIELNSGGQTYVYKVDKVTLVDSNTALVEFDNSSRKLTLSTCNSFGNKEERWVVEATFAYIK